MHHAAYYILHSEVGVCFACYSLHVPYCIIHNYSIPYIIHLYTKYNSLSTTCCTLHTVRFIPPTPWNLHQNKGDEEATSANIGRRRSYSVGRHSYGDIRAERRWKIFLKDMLGDMETVLEDSDSEAFLWDILEDTLWRQYCGNGFMEDSGKMLLWDIFPRIFLWRHFCEIVLVYKYKRVKTL